jgi:glycosyltransferase involved in cell wall biosynthesis
MTEAETGLDGCDVSVVITTYNRANVLPRALDGLVRQEAPGVRYEVVVVDNGSTDATRGIVEAHAANGHRGVRYLFEPRRGIAHGRNTGILASRSPIVAFTDDDVTVARDWLATLKRLMDAHPEVECVGGRVLPQEGQTLPSWLTRDHWGPVALLDYGDTPFHVTATRRLCLITANAAFRRTVFDRIGLFRPDMVAASDNEILVRLWRSGGQGLYTPELVVTSEIASGRLVKGYHRRWHVRHGRYSALMHDEGLEGTNYGRVLGVPAWIYRQMLEGGARWVGCSLGGKLDQAFRHESRCRFALGFVRSRWRDAFRQAFTIGAERP